MLSSEETRVLKAAVEHQSGQLSPADLINGIAQRNARVVENLVSKGYLEEVPHQLPDIHGGHYTVNFYRATEKGLCVFLPWYQKVWANIKGDLRTIIITVATAIITTLITIGLGKLLK